MFGDNMVLQRGKPIRFWGWAKAGESIRVELAGRTATASAGTDGRWQAEIKSPAPGGPYSVTISGAENSVTLHEVLVGEVWLCGGQSNMELGLARARNGAEEIKAANHPQIRFSRCSNRSRMHRRRPCKARGKFALRRRRASPAAFPPAPIFSDASCRTSCRCRLV